MFIKFPKIFLPFLMVILLPFFAASAETTKVGFVYVTSPGDHGWTHAHETARLQVEEHFGDGVETSFVENVAEGPDAERVIRELAEQGNDIIFTTSFGYMEPTIRVAKRYPHIKFEHVTGYKRAANVATTSIRFYEGRFVQGVVAGKITKSNKIGYIAAFPIPEVVMGINAFARGLRSVNPDASISVVWVNSWYDPVKEADATKVLIAEGADVFAQHTDSASMLQIAEKEGLHGFGQASNMEAFGANAQLFSSMNNWGPYYIERIQALKDGTWTTGTAPDFWEGNTWGGFSDDMLKLSPFKNMPDSVAQLAGETVAKIKSGELVVFAGPITSNTGEVIIKAGEELSDAQLWQTNYYVEGVNGSLPQ